MGALHNRQGLRKRLVQVCGTMEDGEGCEDTVRRAGVPRPCSGARLPASLEHSVRRGVLRRPLAGVELIDYALRDALQHLLREDAQQLPAQVQRLEHRAVLVRA